ncbi:MAG: hypothetical protein MJ172_11835 [Clostridia bacterium]|nr:hypothetical protein [Clostridia bacterium]
MIDYRMYFSQRYLVLIINYLEIQISDFPILTVNSKNKNGKSTNCIREYDKSNYKVIHEYLLSSSKGQSLHKIYLEREHLVIKLREYKAIWNEKYNKPIPKLTREQMDTLKNLPVSYNTSMEFYNQLVAQMGEYKYNLERKVSHDMMDMASRIEILFAEELEKLDLNYKYEAEIQLDGENKLTDFFVAIPMINSCFPAEVAGLMSKTAYYSKLAGDLTNYYASNYLLNRSFLFISETEFMPVNTDVLAIMITSFVNQFVDDTLISNKIRI